MDKAGIGAESVEAVLNGLGCKLAADLDDLREGSLSWQVTLPSWRLDLEREIDLIEEIARVYGYNRFANTLPAFGEGVKALPWAEKEAAVRDTLRTAGFHEAICKLVLLGGRGRADCAAAWAGGAARQSA